MDKHTNSNNETEPRKKSHPIFRFLFRLIIAFFILLSLLVGIGYYYQDEVKEHVITELNKQLNTEIIVDGKNIDFTIIKNFPYASINFKNIKALDAVTQKRKDTLFIAEQISLQFNLIDIFKKNYRLKKIEIDNAELKIKIDKNGNDNYHFWKATTDSNSTSQNFSFALEEIIFNNIELFYKDEQTRQKVALKIKRSNLSGNFSNDKFSLSTQTDLFINVIKADSTTYLRKKNIHTEVDLFVDNKESSYKIEHGQIKIEDLLFEAFGYVLNTNNESIVNIGIKGKEMNIQSILSLIPDTYKNDINDYKSDGIFYFDATIKGNFSKTQTPQINASFGIQNATVTQTKNNIVLKNTNLKGNYTNKDKNGISALALNSFSANINEAVISGELFLKNLSIPSFYGKIEGEISLETLEQFIKIDTIETLNGKLTINALFSGESKANGDIDYEKLLTSGDLSVSNMNMKFKNSNLNFLNTNGAFKFENTDLNVINLTGNINESDFDLKGLFRNIIGYAIKENQDLTIEATLNSKYINLNELLSDNETSTTTNSSYKLNFSEHINFNLNSEITHLEFRKFNANNIRGIIKLKDKRMMIDPLKLSTMDGTITTSGIIDGTDSTHFSVICFSEINKISITKMFEQFENFGQTTITDKNLKGITTAKIQFNTKISPALETDLNTIYSAIDMTIENGELNNVESMKSLSRFIELNDLEHVKFSTLKNQIEIKNQIITIPKMEIKSNAINITTSGTHTFNNEISYKIKLSLNELLAKKVIKAKKQNEEFGEIADDGLGRTNIFLSMTGTVDNPVIKYDSKGAIEKLKEDLKVEKQTLKSILKDEFGLFSKDSTLKNNKPKENTKFIIKWDEANPKEEKKEEKKELKKPKKPEVEDF